METPTDSTSEPFARPEQPSHAGPSGSLQATRQTDQTNQTGQTGPSETPAATNTPSQSNTPSQPDALGRFSPAVQSWFGAAFPQGPTPVQARAWKAVAAGENVLVIAPTGSGKTLAAFLHAIDRVMAEKAQPTRASSVRILYISPMKALGADVERNLALPLDGIAGARGITSDEPPVRVGMRTGDTTADERRRLVSHPPDILITTPESLYLMLTSKARDTLRGVETVIVDEVHAIAGNKRGAHLALSLERLDDLLETPAQRIGLSATVQPPEEVARFLGGIHDVRIVRDSGTPALDIEVRVPVTDMTAIPRTGSAGAPSIWPHIESALLDEIEAHTSTIVFVNSRGLCERLTTRLNELYARRHGLADDTALTRGNVREDANTPDGSLGTRSDMGGTSSFGIGAPALIAKAHHGSVAKDRRQLIESELKRGQLRCVVATSSLELGIDMGEVDLVMQVAPPLSVASGLQRIGRANHQVGGRSHGIIYPRLRTEIVDAAVATEGMRAGALERTVLATNALDVLAQQTVAAASMQPDGMEADAWYATVRRAANYAELTRDAFDSVIAMLAGAYNVAELAEFSPRITFDAAHGDGGTILPRPNSQRLAVTAAGTIPDRGMFPVMLPQSDSNGGRRRVGELDEEMVMESRVGDVITLGTSAWRITDIERDRVLVTPAEGRASRLPFWHGDSVGRPFDAGCAKGAFLRAATQALAQPAAAPDAAAEGASAADARSDDGARIPLSPEFEARLARCGLDENARRNLAELVAIQQRATSAVPTDRTLVVERCTDETGDWRLILHSPFGKRVHLPWALAVSARIRETLGFDPEALAADDGIMLRIPMTEESMPPASVFRFDADDIDEIVRRNVEATSLFAARFRECAARALTMTPPTPGRRAPLWQQRIKGGQLLEAARNNPGFPLLAEAARECLTEAYDIASLKQVMRWLETGEVRLTEAETAAPSPFAAPLMFGYVVENLYAGDLPHAERTSSLLAVDPALLGELLGQPDEAALVDEQAFADVEAFLQRTTPRRRVSTAEGVFDLLRELGPLTHEEVAQRTLASNETASLAASEGDEADETAESIFDAPSASLSAAPTAEALEHAKHLLDTLEAQHRAFRASWDGQEFWVASTDAPALFEATGVLIPAWAASSTPASDSALAQSHPLDELVARIALTNVPFTAAHAASRLGTGPGPVIESLGRLEGAGRIRRFGTGSQWVAPSVLRRLRQRSRALAEAAAAPASTDAYMHFLLERQGIIRPESGIDALARVIETFEGIYLPWDAWEGTVFPARVADFTPAMLDELIGDGEVIWCCRDAKPKPEVAFFPTDSPLAPLVICEDFDAGEVIEAAAMAPDEGDRAPENALMRSVADALACVGPADFAMLAKAVRTQADSDPARAAEATDHPAESAASTTRAADAASPGPSTSELVQALRQLVLAGGASASSFQYARSGQLAAESASAQADDASKKAASASQPARRTSSRRSLRSHLHADTRRAHREQRVHLRAFEQAISGTWMRLAPAHESDTARALGITEGLLDCYGIVTRDIALHAKVPGALAGIYPVLKALEEAGDVMRGMFVAGMGPAQFCEREALERIRATEAADSSTPGTLDSEPAASSPSHDDAGIVVLAADDPAWLYGSAVPWPDIAFEAAGDDPALDVARLTVRPKKAPGALLAIRQGRPTLLATPKLKGLIAFTADSEMLRQSVAAIVSHVERQLKRLGSQGARTKAQIESLNGIPVNDTPLAPVLGELGLVWTPEGMRLYVNPF